MEPSITFNYAATQQGTAMRPLPHAHTINPPTSMRVLADLAEHLTLPHSLALQPSKAYARNGAYDNLATHCLSESHKPGPEMLWAYEACTDIIRHHSKSFYFSARLLPAAKRHGIMALYAFCRSSDDLVDNADTQAAREQATTALDAWAALNSQQSTRHDNPVLVAWADTRRRFGIPGALPEELLNGVRMDLTISRYGTWDDLWLYCYRVASTVGLMSMYVTGADTMDAVPYAVQLGVALQLTNILRDVGEDAAAGRIYLPAEDMARFGYTEEMLLGGEVNNSFINLMRYEVARARALYAAACPGIAMLPADSRVAVAAAATVYQGILAKIEAAIYNVFTHRAHLSMAEKVRALPGIWWGTKGMKRKT
ncbi:MAG: phytoene/squalene synthase family protein [Chloroflexota bacterium]|nr:phytoene/squalene synthase family protein [Chloroflexota bacterium]